MKTQPLSHTSHISSAHQPHVSGYGIGWHKQRPFPPSQKVLPDYAILTASLQTCLAPAPDPKLENLRGREMQPPHPILPWNSFLSVCPKTQSLEWCPEIFIQV